MVMEYLDGEPLSRLLRAKRPLDFAEAIAIVKGVAAGLHTMRA
jgi:hypothetical protein